jgi:phage terminase small subunit
MEERGRRTAITADRVLLEISRIALLDLRKLYHPDGTLKAVHELDDETAAGFIGVESAEVAGEAGAAMGQIRKVRMADKVRALELLMRHHGLLNDKLAVDVTSMSDRILAARRRAKAVT